MKTDLAPKPLFYFPLIGLCASLVAVSVIHVMFSVPYDQAHGPISAPFLITSLVWGLDFLAIQFYLRKCRYVVINPSDENKFVYGNGWTSTHAGLPDLTILKRVRKDLYKVEIEGKKYFIFTSDRLVSDFQARKHAEPGTAYNNVHKQ